MKIWRAVALTFFIMEVYFMNKVVRQDVLELNVVMTRDGRVIKPYGSDDQYLLEGGEKYRDQNWQVSLYAKQGLDERHLMVAISYHGQNAVDAGKLVKHERFHTGFMRITLENDTDDQGQVMPRIVVESEDYQDALRYHFGILNGYEFASPNDFVNGLYGDHAIGLSDARSDASGVPEATWAVVCEVDAQEPSNTTVTLYTLREDFEVLLEELDEILEAQEMSGFDDLIARVMP